MEKWKKVRPRIEARLEKAKELAQNEKQQEAVEELRQAVSLCERETVEYQNSLKEVSHKRDEEMGYSGHYEGPAGIRTPRRTTLRHHGGELYTQYGYDVTFNNRDPLGDQAKEIEGIIRKIASLSEKAGKLSAQLQKSIGKPEEELIALCGIDGKIRVVLLGEDGIFRFVDGTEQTHNLLYIFSLEALALREAIEELEYLINNPKAKEQDFQDFFERNPRLILNDEYKTAHPHITLTREEGPLIPDFLLEPIEQNALCDILDLKLPRAKIFVLKKNRARFSAAVMEACAQLRAYSNYFDEEKNRDLIYRNYGLKAYKPKMIVIVGRRGDIDPMTLRDMESDYPKLELQTYDDVLIRAKARLGRIG